MLTALRPYCRHCLSDGLGDEPHVESPGTRLARRSTNIRSQPRNLLKDALSLRLAQTQLTIVIGVLLLHLSLRVRARTRCDPDLRHRPWPIVRSSPWTRASTRRGYGAKGLHDEVEARGVTSPSQPQSARTAHATLAPIRIPSRYWGNLSFRRAKSPTLSKEITSAVPCTNS